MAKKVIGPGEPVPDDSKLYTGEELEAEDGTTYTPQQQNLAGKDNIEGGGEFPSTHTPPRAPAPGAVPESDADDATERG